MRRILLIYVLLIVIPGCMSYSPASRKEYPGIQKTCLRPFPSVRYRVVHSIRGSLPGGRSAVISGISDFTPSTGRIHAVMMSIEGLTFFEAVHDGRMSVKRALPPFDSGEFAEGMMEDIALILMKPRGDMIEAGFISGNGCLCRYGKGNETVEIIYRAGEKMTWTLIRRRNGAILRKVRMSDLTTDGIPERVVLTAYKPVSYTLSLVLMQREAIRY